jgi:hypothetical protein
MRASLVVFGFSAFAAGCVPMGDATGQVEELGWETPLSIETLGFEPGPVLQGASLKDVVSGHIEARGEGRSCTACHFDGSVTFYRPGVAQNELAEIGPYDIVDGRTWAGNVGWGAIFTGMGAGSFAEKPPELRDAFQVFLDQERERVEPIGWDDVITVGNLGTSPDANIAGDRIGEVINSRTTARPDGLMCADCHYAGAGITYRPEIERSDASTTFGPDDLIDGRSWAGPGGWADRFVALGPDSTTHKPDYLRSMFFKWKDDGAL